MHKTVAASADVSIIKRNALRYSLAAIASVFVFEFTAGIITNSLAVLTDSTHALLDAVVTAILIIAVSLAAKPRDKEHTYGHGRIETIGGFIGGVALFVVSIFFIYEAGARLALGGGASSLLVKPGAIGFAAVGYTLAVDVFRMAVLGRATRRTGAATLRADLYHAMADFASTAVALVGLWLVTAGFYQGDAIAAAILGTFLAYLSSRFAYQNAFELTDSIPPRLVARVRQAAAGTEGVLDCKDVKMRRAGNEVFAEVTISLKADISFEKAHETSAQVERNIESSLAEAGYGVKSITVHFEPIYSPDLPLESIIERAAARVPGVKGVHNIIVSRIGGTDGLEVSLHTQVNRSASLSEAHAIASAVEESIKGQVKRAENVTVHLEPLMPEVAGVQPLADIEIQDSIRQIVLASGEIKKVGRIVTFRTDEDTLKIDVDIGFPADGPPATIEQVHERVTEIEKEIRSRYPGSIVTIHSEPG